MITSPCCLSDDIALQDSRNITKSEEHTWVCIFICHCCGQEFSLILGEEERKEYL